MIRMAEPACRAADQVIPKSWMKFLERYSSGSNTIHQKSAWNKLLKALVRIVGTYTAVTLVLILYLASVHSTFYHEGTSGHTGSRDLTRSDPAINSPHVACDHDEKNHSAEFQQLWLDSKYNRGPLVSLIIYVLYYVSAWSCCPSPVC